MIELIMVANTTNTVATEDRAATNGNGNDNDASLDRSKRADVPLSDLEDAAARRERTEARAAETVAEIGNLLDGLSTTVDGVDESTLAPALRRVANELADSVANLRGRLRENDDDDDDGTSSKKEDLWSGHGAGAELTEEERAQALVGAASLLEDVETSLRSVGRDEAEELAEAGLAVAKIFLFTLKSVYEGVAPRLLTAMQRNGETDVAATSDRVERLDDEEEKESSGDGDGPSSDERLPWPPLAPAVAEAGSVGARAAVERPILAAAIAMTLWPAATVAAFVGVPLLALDWTLRSAQDAGLAEKVGRAGQDACRVGKLYLLCGKLLVKRGARIAEKQIERRGGVGRVAADVGGAVVDRIVHPVETVRMAVGGIQTGIGAAMGLGGLVRDAASGKTVDEVQRFMMDMSFPQQAQS